MEYILVKAFFPQEPLCDEKPAEIRLLSQSCILIKSVMRMFKSCSCLPLVTIADPTRQYDCWIA
jgi:hypothetical protein